MPKYGMVIDINKCNGCYNCLLACKDEFSGNDYPPYSFALPESAKPWLLVNEVERGSCPKVKVDYIPIPCQQCEKPACVEKSPKGALYKRDDGIVMIDPEKALNCKELVNSCPHRLIFWNEEKQIAQKCSFCVHLLEKGWKEPRCVAACPSGALLFGDLDDPGSEISLGKNRIEAEALNPGFDLAPKVIYSGLPARMITGEVLLSDRQDVCSRGVKVSLHGGPGVQTTETDYLGDFEFDGLAGHHSYSLHISHSGYIEKKIEVKTYTDVDLGLIILDRQ